MQSAMQSSIGLALCLGYGLAHGLQLNCRAVAPLAATTRRTGVAPPQGRSRRSLVARRCAGCLMKLHDDGVLGVGVIGAGRIGMVHLEALSSCESAKAVIISNPTVSKAQAAAARYKLEHSTCDYMEVINHPEVEAVWICSPSAFHADQIKACAAAGKHVFCYVEAKACMAGQGGGLAEAGQSRGSLGHNLALQEASGEPAGRWLSCLVLHTGLL